MCWVLEATLDPVRRCRTRPIQHVRTAAADSPEQLFAWLDESQQLTERVVTDVTDLDALAQGAPDDGDPCSLRWILLHLVQEYGRHLGHADLIRESIDGTVGV